jgi:transposase
MLYCEHMPTYKYIVALEKSKRTKLLKLVRKGKSTPARTITRARVLLMADNNEASDPEICKALKINKNTPFNIRKRYCTEGLNTAIYDKPRPGKKRSLSAMQEAHIVALACTTPPHGSDHWTMKLLTQQVNDQIKDNVSQWTVNRVLLRHELKPWREKNVGDSRVDRKIYRTNDGCVRSI